MKIDKHLRITMTRRQVCKLLLACSALQVLGDACAGSVSEWGQLHDELLSILHEYDVICGRVDEEGAGK